PPPMVEPPPFVELPAVPVAGAGPPAPGVTVGRTGPVVGDGFCGCVGAVGDGGDVWIAIGPGGGDSGPVHCAPTVTSRNSAAPARIAPAVSTMRAPAAP